MFLQTNLTENIIPRIGQRIVEYILTTPALLMRISTRSSSFLMTSTNFRTDDITLMSTCLQTTFEFPVSCTILSLATSAFSGFRQARITLPLLSARPRAVSNPIPCQWTEGRKQNVMEINKKFDAIHTLYVCSFRHFIFVLLKKEWRRQNSAKNGQQKSRLSLVDLLFKLVMWNRPEIYIGNEKGFHLIFRHFIKVLHF